MRRAAALAVVLTLAAPSSWAQANAALDLYVRPEKGHCIACHQLPQGVGPASRSDLGPPLSGARMRELGKATLRELLDDPQRRNPDTLMPPFGRHRLLDEREIASLVDFLHALP